jgi:hypothetical protein
MRRLFLALAFACATPGAAPAQAQQPSLTADQVKAGFLYHFTAFVDWPDPAVLDSIVVGVLGGEEVEAELRRIVAAKRSSAKSITVRRLHPGDDLAGIQVLYVGAGESQRLERAVAAVRGTPTLVVSDTPEGLERGAMINFVTTDRVQFEVSLESAHRGGLRLSPRLLSVAIRVKKSGWDQAPAYALQPRSAPRGS